MKYYYPKTQKAQGKENSGTFLFKRKQQSKSLIMKLFGYLITMIFLLLLILPGISFAQVRANGLPSSTIADENPFFDASTNFNEGTNIGKGLVFPRTDLRIFTFKTGMLDGIDFPTAYDGMIVYNSGAGSTLPGQGIVTEVSPGFYYFKNPTGETTITSGKWIRLTDINDLVTAPVIDNGTSMATGDQIYDFTTQQISDSIHSLKPLIFERDLVDSENNIDVGFSLNNNTEVYYNGQAILKSQWTGIGTEIIYLELNTRLFDKLMVKR